MDAGAQERRRQLLVVAADLFARHGYHGTTTSMLAEAAGVTEPVLYRHFSSKQELFLTLVAQVSDEVIDAWHQALEGVDEPRERLRILLAGNPATHARGKAIYRVLFRAMTEAESDRRIAGALRTHVRRLHAFLEKELESIQRDGALRGDEQPADIAWLLINVAVGYAMIMPLGLRGASSAAARRAAREVLRDLLT